MNTLTRYRRRVFHSLVRTLFLTCLFCRRASEASAQQEYLLVPAISFDQRVQEPGSEPGSRVSKWAPSGTPLIGSVPLADSRCAAERKIAQMLRDGCFVLNPQVNILLTQAW